MGEITFEEFDGMAQECRNWGRWGDEDQIGTLNHITGDSILAGKDEIRDARVFALAIDFGPSGPQITGQGNRFNPLHWMLESGADWHARGNPHGYADDVFELCVHGATHWDGLGHGFYDGKMYGGHDMRLVDGKGAHRNAITAVKDRFAGRGVLLDIPRLRGADWLEPGHGITPDELEECLDAQRVKIAKGDFLLIRTGQIGHARKHGWGAYAGGDAPGLTLATARWIKDSCVAAVATDTWGAEVRPNEYTGMIQPWHRLAIPNMGLTIGEMFNLEELAEACADDGRYTFFLSAPPLPLEHATGSPVNPLAIR